MKQKIAILGSTGSIGKNLLEILKKKINDMRLFYSHQIKIIWIYSNKQKNIMLKT